MKKNEGRILPFIDMEHVPTKNYMCGGEGEEITRIHPFDLYLYFLGERLDEEIRKWGFHDLRTFVSMGILSALPSDASQRHPRS
ncbi:MAG: hypothetical protein LBJ96_04535 [Holosporaceae bacterium]|nr:hypothetical protein [Holosporaceae bacterium]